MIKRTTAIILILLVNVLLLAHAVVPHHHHQKQVCAIKSHCVNENNADGHNTNGDNHNHDDENDSNNCVLKELNIVLSNQWKQEFKYDKFTTDRSGNNDFLYPLISFGTETLLPILNNGTSVPITNSSYSVYVSISLGLRAPPVV